MVIAPKKDGALRQTDDLQQANHATLREMHHTHTPHNLVSDLPVYYVGGSTLEKPCLQIGLNPALFINISETIMPPDSKGQLQWLVTGEAVKVVAFTSGDKLKYVEYY